MKRDYSPASEAKYASGEEDEKSVKEVNPWTVLLRWQILTNEERVLTSHQHLSPNMPMVRRMKRA